MTLQRDWTEGVTKCEQEGCCRVCFRRPYQIAHLAGRRYDERSKGPRGGRRAKVRATEVVPLCLTCHGAYDAHRLNLMPYLRPEEIQAVETLLGPERARIRLSGSRR